jgi:hypothetical protein
MHQLFVVFAPNQTPLDESFIDGIIGENVWECTNNKVEYVLNIINIKLQPL